MQIDDIRKFCHTLHSVTEDVKWGNDLCFSIGGKMFCVTSLTEPFGVSFKVKDEEFDELSNSEGFIPAPYVARYKWVLLQDAGKISKKQLQFYIKQSYELIKSKLPKKVLKEL
jgi:predicted DNA-binding protein (MmcQ/YjbR family)